MEFLIVEIKSSTTETASGLATTVNYGAQLSDTWVNEHIENTLPNADYVEYEQALELGNVTRLKADVTSLKPGEDVFTSNGAVRYREVESSSDAPNTAVIGDVWVP